MNNINNIISVINENGGTATEEGILCAYVNMWHVLPIPENKQKIKSTLIAHDGKEVFYNKEKNTWSTAPQSINTVLPKEIVHRIPGEKDLGDWRAKYQRAKIKLPDAFSQPGFSIDVRSKKNEKNGTNRDLIVYFNEKRIAGINFTNNYYLLSLDMPGMVEASQYEYVEKSHRMRRQFFTLDEVIAEIKSTFEIATKQ